MVDLSRIQAASGQYVRLQHGDHAITGHIKYVRGNRVCIGDIKMEINGPYKVQIIKQ